MTWLDHNLTLAEEAYNRIKNSLCSGEMAPGTVLSESRLADRLNMSRTPVRAAIRMLEMEGWLEAKKGIGTYVRRLSSKDIADLFEVRRLMEPQAARTAIFHITGDEIDDFEKRFRSLCESFRSDAPLSPGAFSDLDQEFHELFISRCENSYIRRIMETNNENLRRYQRLSFDTLHDLRESTRQHLELISLMRKQDPEALAEALSAHIAWAAGVIADSYSPEP